MAYKFDIYAGTTEDVRTLTEEVSNEQKALPSQPKSAREFRPRVPQSAKVGRGERGALVRKMISKLESEIKAKNPSYTQDNVVKVEEESTDLYGVDPDIREILNQFGIFYYAQIPSWLITTYGSLLSRKGAIEDYQRLVEKDLLDDGDDLLQEKLGSQNVLFK